jgi:hypothetical protein
MLTRVPLGFKSAREARATLTAFRKRYRVALRGACVTGPDYHGLYSVHVQFGATGFSPAEMADAMQSIIKGQQ